MRTSQARSNRWALLGALLLAVSGCESSGGSEPVNLKSKQGVADTSICTDVGSLENTLKAEGGVLEYADNHLIVMTHYFAQTSFVDLTAHYDQFCANKTIERRSTLSLNHENTMHFIAYKKNLRLPTLSADGKALLQSNSNMHLEYQNPGYGIVSWNDNLTIFAVREIMEQAGIEEPTYRIYSLGPVGRRLIFVHGSLPQ